MLSVGWQCEGSKIDSKISIRMLEQQDVPDSVNVVAAENPEFILFSFDVGQASADGLTFEEFSALTGTALRQVDFDVPRPGLECLRQLPGFSDFGSSGEALAMLKPMYGLEGAPRAWRKQLHQGLIQWVACRQSYTEPELYCVRKIDEVEEEDLYERANAHNEEQQESGTTRLTEAHQYIPGNLHCLFSVRVDDIQGTARSSTADSLLAHLNDKVGRCKAGCDSSMHAGIQREYTSGFVFTHQCAYIGNNTLIGSRLLIWKYQEPNAMLHCTGRTGRSLAPSLGRS